MDPTGDFPAYLRAQLAEKDWTSADLGRHAGVHPASISKWLRGLEVPSVENSRKVADALGANLLEILVSIGILTRDEVRGRGTVVDLERLSDDQLVSELRRRLAAAAGDITEEEIATDSERFTTGRPKRSKTRTSTDTIANGS
jgi:transcriptional regulator with XRE-family HTH domain